MAENLERDSDVVADNAVRLEEITRRLNELGDREQQNFYYNIGEQLRLLGDELNNTEKSELVGLLEELSFASTTAGSASVPFVLLIRKFVLLVANKARISAEAVKTTIRLFLRMWNNKALRNEVKEVINSSSAMEMIPSEVETMDSEFINLYHQALSQGYQRVKDIRLMIVGMFGVGKTSLMRNIVDECQGTTYQNRSPESTVGIDVIHCDVLEDGRWSQTHNTGSSAADKLSQIISQRKWEDNTDGSTGSAGPLPSLQNKTEPPSTSLEVSQDSSGTIIYQRSPVDQQQGHSDSADFTMKSDDDRNIDRLMHDVKETVKTDHEVPLVSDTRVAVWDFAGQNIYYSTHHFFLNSRSIYLLLMDVSKPLNSLVEEIDEFPISGFLPKDFTCLEAFKFWLRSIYMYYTTQIRDASVKLKPSIILVGTHKDELNGNDDEKERQKEDFFNEALKSFLESPVLKLVRPRKFLVNNLDNKEDYASIRTEVLNTAKEQKYWNEKRPAKWIQLERSLEGLKKERKEIISFDELKEEDQKNKLPLKSDSELKLFLHFQHSLGNLLFFESELLQRCIILTPQWIIKAFRCFISHMPDKNPEQLSLWDDYEQRAILSYELINEIIDKNPKNMCFRDYKKEIVGYMELLDMIARPVNVLDHDEQQEVCHGDSHGDEHNQAGHGVSNESCLQSRKDFYIVPLRLRSRPDEKQLSKWLKTPQAKSKTPILAMVFKDGFLPPSVFHRLLAICITKWPVQKTGGQLLLYNGFAGFRIPRTSTLTIWFQDHRVYARVCSYEDETDSRHLCVEVRRFLSNSLKSILSIMPNKGGYGEVLPFEEFIQCHHIATFKPGVGLIRLRALLDGQQPCEDCEEEHVITKEEGLGLWCNLESNTLSKDVLLRCPTPTELVQIALSCIGNEYHRLGLELGVCDKRLEQIREVERFHVPTATYNMFVEARKGSELTVEMLRNKVIAIGADVTEYDKLLKKSGNEDGNTVDGVDIEDGNECPNDCTLAKLCECIGHEYWLLGIVLGLSEIRIQHLREEYKQPPTRNYNMLLEWKKLNSNATTCKLLNAMKLVGSDYSEAKKQICSTPMSE